MITADENKMGYIAIGDAVLENINEQEEISFESLMQTLNEKVSEVASDEERTHILQGRSLLSETVKSHN